MATIKLASVFVRTLSKPLASSIKGYAKEHPKFKQFCVSVAQRYHALDIRLKRSFLDYKSDVVRPLSEARAVELGANFIGESIIFSVTVLTIFAEIYRNSRNSKNQKEEVDESIRQLQSQVETLNEFMKEYDKRIVDLEQTLNELSSLKSSIPKDSPSSVETDKP